MYTYLLINGLTIVIPLLLSFESRVRYVTKWKYLFPAILIVGGAFVAWDYFFTQREIWGFNPQYLVGIDVFGLPLEEVLFFICIPFACVFIYEVVIYLQGDVLNKIAPQLTYVLIIVFGIIGITNLYKIYTSVTFISLGVLLLIHFVWLKPRWLGYFYFMYLLSFIPFLIVNGILTHGLSFITPHPVVWYNNAANLGLRFMGIPVEDFFYSMLLLLGNITVYEFLKKKY